MKTEHFTPEIIRRHVTITKRVFFALGALTALTVTLSYFKWNPWWAVGVALLIASIKSSLVAGFFMHLAGERKIIFILLIFALFFFALVLLTPTFARF